MCSRCWGRTAVHAVSGSSQARAGQPHTLRCAFWLHVTLSARTVRLVSYPAHEITVSDEKYCSCFRVFLSSPTVSVQQRLRSLQSPLGSPQALDQSCVCAGVCPYVCICCCPLVVEPAEDTVGFTAAPCKDILLAC